jgi:hypothetical protein
MTLELHICAKFDVEKMLFSNDQKCTVRGLVSIDQLYDSNDVNDVIDKHELKCVEKVRRVLARC